MEVHFLMAKLTIEQKILIYEKRKQGETLNSLSKQFNIGMNNIYYLVRLIDAHGYEILRRDKDRYYSPELKLEIINRVILDGESAASISIEYGLTSNGMLFNWIKTYKDNNYVIIEKKRGRLPIMTKQENKKKYEDMTAEEKVKFLEDKNLYLEAENEYLKKLKAVVQTRKNRQQKKK